MSADARTAPTALKWLGILVTAGLGALSPPSFGQTSSAATILSSSINGVTVKVIPKALGPADKRWEFDVVLDTHSAELNDDLMAAAVLTTQDGRTFNPVAWTGAAPGGHHREGVLAFEAPVPRPSAIELKLKRPGETQARVFRWQL